MKIRSQLVLACFLLSVLPLSVIVVYSYHSSHRALETAYRREADARTKQMDRRLATIRGDLQQRLAEVSALPMTNGASDRTPDVGNILLMMGDAASLVDSLEDSPGAGLRSESANDRARGSASRVEREQSAESESQRSARCRRAGCTSCSSLCFCGRAGGRCG